MLYMDYKDKYIKYKSKYLELKQKGGMNCVNQRVFQNLLGTCWMIAIQMMMCFGDATKNQIERELAQPDTSKESIGNLDKILKKIFPSKYSCLETTKRIKYLTILLDTFINIYISKIERHISVNPKENGYRCEFLIRESFSLLFQNLININTDGGSHIDYYFFANLLGIFFLKQEIYFSMHTRKIFNKIRFDEQDIGIIITIKEHACCFFVCGGVPKFYNDHDKKIYDFNFMNLLINLKDDEDLFVVPNQVVALNRTEYFENINKYEKYKRIEDLTVVSKKNFRNNFNQEIKLFFDEEFDKINNFFLLLKIGLHFLNKDNQEKYFYFINKGLKDEYLITMYLLGDYYSDIDQLDKAIEYYQKALDNGYNKAAIKLSNIYENKGDIENAIKYLTFDFYTREQ